MSERMPSYRETLRGLLGEKRYAEATKSYDILGNIAIIDAKGATAKKIAKAVMATNKNVETVLRKGGAISGRYRTRKYHYVAGKRNFIARYRENNSVFEFDVRKAYFSARLAYERRRIINQVRNGERVMVMFAGVGPFAIEIAKAKKKTKVVAIELNKYAYRYMLDNIRINKTPNVTPILGDVKKVAEKYYNFADRIIMPLPKDSYSFLGSALEVAKRGCVIHYYAFGESKKAFEQHSKKLIEFFQRHKRGARIVGKRVVRPYSATEVEIVLDAKIRR